MPGDWDDFDKPAGYNKRKRDVKPEKDIIESNKEAKTSSTCDWGFGRQYNQVSDEESNDLDVIPDSRKFASIYEKYLENKSSFSNFKTKNLYKYQNNPEKTLKEWFDIEGHNFEFKTEQPSDNQYICTIDIPIDDQDFTISSEIHSRKRDAVEQICLTACKLLDDCALLYSWQSTNSKQRQDDDEEENAGYLLEKRRLLMEANKEDDIELDSTSLKFHAHSGPVSESIGSNLANGVNTYESLMAKWNELNMLILQLKAKLVKLDLSVTQKRTQQQQQSSTNKTISEKEVKDKSNNVDDDSREVVNDNADDEIDPLDEYMSTLNTKTKLSMDEKIEKSRIKSQIVSYEREQTEVSRLIELAKPKFNLNKVCPPKLKRT